MTRNITDCHETLLNAYNEACTRWMEQYPDASEPFITCAYRSKEEQQATYNQGRTLPGAIVTWALPGQSAHNYLPSFAFDVAFKNKAGQLDWNPDNFKLFADLIKQIDSVNVIEWGGDFPIGKHDMPHFEVKNWYNQIPKAPIA